MKYPLNILHLEDSPNDAQLIQSSLNADGIDPVMTLIQTRREFITALEKGGIDLILSDFSLPGFDGLSAVQVVQERWPNIPIILVSGTLGEELAIESMKSGATDYVLKDRLSRLAPAVRRAMQEVEERKERERLEARFIEAQKMEVIGQLSAGVAHDFNNILAVIMGYSDLLISQLPAGSPLQPFAKEIQHASERAAGLTRQLLVFSRRQTVQAVVLDLNQVIHELHPMLRRLVDENIEITIVPEKEIGRIQADPGYVGQVLMNLVVNARDAMLQGGRLTISTNNVTLDKNHFLSHTKVVQGDYVMLSVRDTGTGMTEEVKARLFEAFFSTKPSGKGTGLGLATCQTIVQQSNGYISVQTELGKGTAFEIYFPRVEMALEAAIGSVPVGPLPRGKETLLVVEDDPSVRHLAASVLEAQGYTVLRACNGQDGLRVAQEHQGEPLCLVVTDVIMPLMGGKVMAEWLETTHPEIKILFTSGYTDDALANHGIPEAGIPFLHKPYTPARLVIAVREMLDKE